MRGRFSNWRLSLINVVSFIAVCIILYRIVHVQIIRHDNYREKAEKQWHRKVAKPAIRGNIYDRNGLPLAAAHRTYSIGITPTHFRVDEETVRDIASVSGLSRSKIRRMTERDCAYVPLASNLQLTGDDAAKISSIPGIRLDQVQSRVYPLSTMASRLIGSVNHNGCGVVGIEKAFQEMLAGREGWVLATRDAKDQSFQFLNAPGKKASNGCDLYLTIDSRIQSIIDFELGQALKNYGAKGGVAIIVEPRTGEMLALAEKFLPGGTHAWGGSDARALYATSCIYEPGSTFKLITDSYLLERGLADPYDAFYGEKGKAEFDFGSFCDDHPFEWLTFKESFVHSSNICTIKAIMNCDPDDFYRYILEFGFYAKTGIDLPAESRGTLKSPDEWSSRTLPSISIGHEIGVTALQMVMAYCTVANDGILMTPLIAKELRDEKGRIVESYRATKVRRVYSPETASRMRAFCRDVVRKGTGAKAAVEGLAVAGKTGTSQKAGKGGYERGKYIASFAGFAPVEDPKLVCLVVLDEPRFPYYWGGQSAAVVFNKIIEGINLGTDIFFEETGREIVMGSGGEKMLEVPNFLRMTCGDAENVASSTGFRVQLSGSTGTVYSQFPGPGTYLEPGGLVHLLFREEKADGVDRVIVPNLLGLSIREARRLLIACRLKSRIEGYGVIDRQSPKPGRSARCGSTITLHCSSRHAATMKTASRLKGGDRY